MTYEEVKYTTAFLKKEGFDQPEIAIILGTGLGKLVDHIQIEKSLPYDSIPNFPIATVEFHSGKLIYGNLEGKKVIAMQGRFHAYEGYSQEELSFPIRIFKALGVKQLIISNAAGAINKSFKKGELMLLDDHIHLQGGSPLTGLTDPAFGERFVDLAEPYNCGMNSLFKRVAEELNIKLHEGVYACVHGPHLETRAEYRFLSIIGADAVGMSTVPEVIVANQIGLPCAAISVLTDECDPDNLKPVDIQDIIATAGEAESKLVPLIRRFIRNTTPQ
jgi:purine-nucleoside phosphorylase